MLITCLFAVIKGKIKTILCKSFFLAIFMIHMNWIQHCGLTPSHLNTSFDKNKHIFLNNKKTKTQ